MKAGLDMMARLRNIFYNIFSSRSICILGVDGTGKTSVTIALKKYLGQNSIIQYMGLHSYLTGYARSRYNAGNYKHSHVSAIINFTALYLEMWFRVICHWKGRKIIIYDRYAWEIMFNYKGIKRALAKLLFKTLFPRPKLVLYLYCTIEVSLSRKTDIIDIAEFKGIKQEYDREFMHCPGIIPIDTGSTDVHALLEQIIKILPKKLLENITV